MDAPIVSREKLQHAYDQARAADADHELAIEMVAHIFALSEETVAEVLEQQHASST
jgi:hypothetical protein